MVTQPYEVETDVLSESVKGRPILVNSISNVAADAVHIITNDDALDAVWLWGHNNHSATLTLHVVMSPNDDTVAADVDDATLSFKIPRNTSLPLLEGERLRKITAAYTLGVWVEAAGQDLVSVRGHYIRRIQGEVTA